ncbi:MAG TPA: glutaredoxin family protein [Candidatus Competibacter sp.]|nr:glutaredoxin family protein [Candidatus Competibacter sp.]
MKTLKFLILSFVPLLALAGTLYKSVGPDGRIIYSDRPPTDGRVEKKMDYAPDPASPLPAYVLRFKEELEKRLRQRASETPPSGSAVQLFTTSWCGFCRKAKAYLAKKQIAYTEYDVETPEGMEALVRAGGGQGVPILFWRGKKIHGFSELGYDALFADRP